MSKYKELQQDDKVSHREETKLYRNEIKKKNATSEALREIKNFDEKFNLYLRNRFKVVNGVVLKYINNSYKGSKDIYENYRLLMEDVDLLAQIDCNAEYVEGEFDNLLRTTNFGKNLSLTDSTINAKLNNESQTLYSLDIGNNLRKSCSQNNLIKQDNRHLCVIDEKSEFFVGNQDNESKNKITAEYYTIQKTNNQNKYDDLLSLSFDLENKKEEKSNNSFNINPTKLATIPIDIYMLKENENSIEMHKYQQKGKYSSTGNLLEINRNKMFP